MKSTLKKLFNPVLAWLLDYLARSCSSMPFSRKKKLAQLLTFFVWRIIGLRRREVIASLQLHLELTEAQAEKLGEKVYQHFLLNSFEMASLAYISREDLLARIKIEGLEHLDTAMKRNHGAIIVSGHFGLWEMIPQWLAVNGYPVCTVVRRQNNPHVDAWMENMRRRLGGKTTDSGFGIREILRSIRRGQILALMVDQDNGKQGIFVPFFRRYASAPTGPAQLSLKTGAPIVPLFMFPNYCGQHLFKIYPPIYPENYTNDITGQQQITACYTQLLEELVRQQPQDWFWLHRRWKTQPAYAPDNPWARLANDQENAPR
ncbi:MAG: Lipid A biosynthesis lauroyl acyltransferase [Candidatus Rifleibacterium amylolyticum]|nr:MAG: Lipid A biosynthesis lauroyl acyltransferase [Candidatus Rifleibacterium amylolyticum]